MLSLLLGVMEFVRRARRGNNWADDRRTSAISRTSMDPENAAPARKQEVGCVIDMWITF